MRTWALLLGLLTIASAQALPQVDPHAAEEVVEAVVADPEGAAKDPQGALAPVLDPPEETEPVAPEPPGFADRVREAFGNELLVMGLAGTAASVLGLLGFALVTRYVSPKEALQNPQRAMLFGYVRGHPGVHLKSLSEEFAMKTSSILWHIRKLEAAELVRSERANGYRVFYPVAGGIEMKRVSRAITALHNENARRIFAYVHRHSGSTVRQASEALSVHGGTVRWHLRKLREFGLVEELVRDDGSRFYGTPLGAKALGTLEGEPVGDAKRSPLPLPE